MSGNLLFEFYNVFYYFNKDHKEEVSGFYIRCNLKLFDPMTLRKRIDRIFEVFFFFSPREGK